MYCPRASTTIHTAYMLGVWSKAPYADTLKWYDTKSIFVDK
jgi:hypothetical protein